MHPAISRQLAQARVANLRQQVQRDTLVRAARRARPGRRGHAGPVWPTPRRRVRGRTSPRTVLAIASLGGAVAFIDATIVNIAFPDIARSFPGASISMLSWVLNGYNIVFAAFLMAAAGIADLLGRRRVFVFGLELFTVGSLLCAVAPSADALIAFRVVQALGAALLVPSALALVLTAFPPARRSHGIALLSAVGAAAAGFGPSLGGLLVTAANWRLVFLVNIPIGVAAALLARRQLAESRAPGRRRIPDLPGTVLFAIAIGALVLGVGRPPGAVLPRRPHQVRPGPGQDGQADLPRLPGQCHLPELGAGQRPGGRYLGRPDRRRTTQAAPPRPRLSASYRLTHRGKVMTRTLPERSGLPGSTGNGRPPEPLGFLSAYPVYQSTALLDRLRATQYSYLDAAGHVYLDYAGAGLPAQAQLAAHAERTRGRCFGNPHSENPASAASTELIERARLAVLAHFNAPPEEYAAIFTPNATGACRLVGEAYPFGPRTRLVLTQDNHNSVNGIREFAASRGAVTRYVPFSSPDLRVDDDAIRQALDRPRPGPPGAAWRVARSGVAPWSGRGSRARRQRSLAQEGVRDADRSAAARRRGLLAYPAQSNFSGVQHPLHWIQTAHEHGYDVLLDAAAYVPSNRLDLSVVKPDFVPVSWYKVFGYPTGVGCLIARREALGRLWRPWFAGGSVYLASVQGGWHTLAPHEARFEDGTVAFLQIPDLEAGLSWVNGIGIDRIHQRVTCLTGWLLGRLADLRHGNGEPMARIYGPVSTRDRGGTVAFNLLDPGGRVIDERAVARDTAAAGISIRTGCHCNPGASEGASQLTNQDWRKAARARVRTMDQYLDLLGLPSAGALRASVGLASNAGDVERFLAFVELTYRDRVAGAGGLAPRRGC